MRQAKDGKGQEEVEINELLLMIIHKFAEAHI